MTQVLVCRTCLRVIEKHAKFVNLDANDTNPNACEIKSKLEACVPEMTLDAVKNPVICGQCIISLDAAFAFKKNCLRTEEEIYEYMFQSNVDKIDLGFIAERAVKSDALVVKIEIEIDDTVNDSTQPVSDINQDVDLQQEIKVELSSKEKEKEHYEKACELDTNENVFENSASPASCAEVSAPEQNLSLPPCFVCVPRLSEDVVQALNIRNMEVVEDPEPPSSNSSTSTYKSKCFICNRFYNTKEQLKNHSNRHTANGIKMMMVGFPYNANTSEPMRMELRRKRKKDKRFRCGVCKLKLENALEDHIRTHTGEKPFQCTSCNFRAGRRDKLKCHMKIHEKTKNPKKPIQINHLIEKRYKCISCKFCTTNKALLKQHSETHAGDSQNYLKRFSKFYDCIPCKFSSVSKDKLKEHMQICLSNNPVVGKDSVEVDKKQTLLKCSMCKFSTNLKRVYKEHWRVHVVEAMYKCVYCDFTTKTSAELVSHTRSHSGGNLYKCGNCEFTTDLINRLECHINVHNSAGIYKCFFCKYRTYVRVDYNEHTKVHVDAVLFDKKKSC